MKILIAFKKCLKDEDKWHKRLAAKLTAWWTNSEYFHIEIALQNKWVSAHTDKGIEVHDLKPIYDNRFDYYEMKVPELTEYQNNLFWEYLDCQCGTGYDWKGIFLTQILKLDWESKNKWFCSEIVAKLLQMLYVKESLHMKPNRISPQDIFEALESKLTKVENHTDL